MVACYNNFSPKLSPLTSENVGHYKQSKITKNLVAGFGQFGNLIIIVNLCTSF